MTGGESGGVEEGRRGQAQRKESPFKSPAGTPSAGSLPETTQPDLAACAPGSHRLYLPPLLQCFPIGPSLQGLNLADAMTS